MAAFVSLVLGGLAGFLHPRPHNFSNHPRSYLEHAANHPTFWFVVHLGLLAAALLLAASIAAAGLAMIDGRSGLLARVAIGAGPANWAIIVAFFAVDGIAVRDVARRWMHAKPADRAAAYDAAAAVERVANSLQCLLAVTLGIAIVVLALTVIKGAWYPGWIGRVGLAAGTLNVAGGIALAGDGTNTVTIYVNLVGTLACFAWQAWLGVRMLRRAGELETVPSVLPSGAGAQP